MRHLEQTERRMVWVLGAGGMGSEELMLNGDRVSV